MFKWSRIKSIIHKPGLLLALTLGIFAFVGWLDYREMVASSNAAHAQVHSLQVINEYDQLLLNLQGAEAAQQGYLFTGKKEYQQSFDLAAGGVADSLTALRSMAQDNSRQRVRLDRIEPATRATLTQLRAVIQLRPTKGPEAAEVVEKAGQSRRLIEEIGQMITVAKADETRMLHQYSLDYAANSRKFITVQLAAAILICLLPFALLKWQGLVRLRGQAEETARQNQERLRLAIAAAKLGTWDWNILTDEAVWSPRCFELFGVSPGTRMNYQRFLETIHPEDRDVVAEAIRLAVEQHQDYDVEMRAVWPDGSVHYVAGRGHAQYDPSGRPLHMFGVVMDITKRKQAEHSLRAAKEAVVRANKELEERVQQRTAKLREAMRELEHMSYSMMHDMRAPLRAMQSFAMLLEQEYAGSLPAQGLDYSRRIRESANRLDHLVTDALNYTRVVREDFPLTPVEVGSLLRGMIETYPDLREPAADVAVEFDKCVVQGNQSLLTQCFGNLLNNAVKFVAPGVKPRVRVRAEARGEMVRIWVEDNGIGIPPDARERIFGLFQRAHRESEYPGTGTGTGLAIARKAVERMGGRLGLESEPGKGSKFWVELASGTRGTA